jgi:hypothetical protein
MPRRETLPPTRSRSTLHRCLSRDTARGGYPKRPLTSPFPKSQCLRGAICADHQRIVSRSADPHQRRFAASRHSRVHDALSSRAKSSRDEESAALPRRRRRSKRESNRLSSTIGWAPQVLSPSRRITAKSTPVVPRVSLLTSDATARRRMYFSSSRLTATHKMCQPLHRPARTLATESRRLRRDVTRVVCTACWTARDCSRRSAADRMYEFDQPTTTGSFWAN